MSKVHPYSKSSEFAKRDGHTVAAQTPGTKQIKQEFLNMGRGQPSTISWAPTSRVFDRDYRVPDEDDATNQDTVTPFVGNPLIW